MARSTQHEWFSLRRAVARRPDQQRPAKRQPFHRPLRIEPLEDRRLLALVTVDTLSDTVDLGDGVTSLREAIFATNLVGGADTIDFAPSLTSSGPATLTLTQGEMAITDTLTINGPGENLLTIDASGNDPTPDQKNGDGSRVFNIDDGIGGNVLDVSISGMTLTGGDVGGSSFVDGGGAVRSFENLTVITSTISGNSAIFGGGIRSLSGNMFIADSTLNGNSARGDGGGAISNTDASVTVTGSTLTGNSASGRGGAIRNSNGTLTLIGSTINGNSATSDGGGIWNLGGTLTVTDSTINGNSAGNNGGGISGQQAINLIVTGSTISGNTAATDGGGIWTFVTSATVIDSTISDNTAGRDGGGIFRLGAGSDGLGVTNSTISGNSAGRDGGGIRARSPTALKHTIVARNTRGAAAAPNDVTGSVTLAFSLLCVDTGATITDNGGNHIGTAAAPIDPLLGPLADNGGPTFTHALLASSPAINRGDLSAVAGVGEVPEFDQRGAPFGRVFNGRIDIGAFEYQAASDLNLIVDTLVDESDGNYALGDLSLREALLLANTYPSTDTIRFDTALSGGTILLSMGELAITGHTTIEGLGASLLTIDASGNDPTPDVNNGDGSRVFNINNGTSALRIVSISGLTLTGGDASGAGGAIFVSENLTVADSIITGNATTSGGIAGGGGIYSLALTGPANTLTVLDSEITGNSAVNSEGGGIRKRFGRLIVDGSTLSGNVAAEAGGGISAAEGNVNVQISGSTVSDNHVTGMSTSYDGGGGLFFFFANTTITGSTISGNTAVDGGGIYCNGGSLSVTGSTIEGNSSINGDGGGIFSRDGRLTVTGSTISGNMASSTGLYGYTRGGGIYHRGNSNARLTVTSSTIEGNSAKHGGGIYGHYTTVTGSTISGNTAGLNGGGIVARYNLSVTSSTINGNSAGREGGGIWSIRAAVTVTGGTISGNSATNRGGGIYGGYTTVTGSTISGNSAGQEGGGIVARYNLSVTSSTISGNSAGREGGGISRITFGNTTVTDSTISGNSASNDGGGISGLSYFGSIDTLTVTNSTISGNSSGRDGGGIWKGTLGVLTVTGSTISDNSAVRDGGGIFGGGTITTSSISGNSAGGFGGGISNGSGTLTVTASSIQRNTASLGAGIFNASGNVTVTESAMSANRASGNGGAVFARGAGSVTVVNSTISGNSSTGSAGGLYLFGTGSAAFSLRHSTIAFNGTSGVGGGVFLVAGPLSLDHAILATNTALLGPDVTAMGDSVLSARYSLIGANAGSGLAAAPVGAPDANGNLIGGPGNAAINPLLRPLLDNGGPTLAHALLVGSPALDAGDTSALAGVGTVPTVDQRGAPFVRVFGARIDIGAYERQSVSGLELIVSSLTDVSNGNYFPGDLSLREAIGLANGSVGSADSISFDSSLTGLGPRTILLTNGELKIIDALAIDGPGANLLTVDASGNDSTPDVNNGDGSRVFNIDDGLVFPNPQQVQNVAISGLSLTGGDVNGDGGAIRNRENLTVTDSTISGNSAIGSGVGNPSAVRGGGIYSSGNLSVARSTISGNSVTGRGGGIWSYGGFFSTLTVTDSTFDGNSASNSGGGIETSGTTSVTNSTFSGNSARYGYGGGGGIRSATGALMVTGSTISGNSTHYGSGGGISGSAGSNLTVTDSTINGNSAGSKGGGIYGFFETVTNSTISGNSAGHAGGGIYSEMGNLTITSSTISGNSAVNDGGGIRAAAERRYGYGVFSHTIVAGNTRGVAQTPNDVIGGVTMSFSLLGVDTGAAITDNGGNLIGTAALPIDPLLGPLADNGGPTMTHALLPDSPAINAGRPSAIAGAGGIPLYDQRGGPFTRVSGGRIDIGALEEPTPPALPGDYNQDGSVDAADSVVRRNVGTSVAPYGSADGNGDGIVDQLDHVVWTAHFGQTLSPPAAGNGAGLAEAKPQAPAVSSPVAPIRDGEDSTGGGTLAEPMQLVAELRSDENSASRRVERSLEVVEPGASRGELLAPRSSLRIPNRAANRVSFGARPELGASHCDDALMGWLAPQRGMKKQLEESRAVKPWRNEDVSQVDNTDTGTIDQVFALLASG